MIGTVTLPKPKHRTRQHECSQSNNDWDGANNVSLSIYIAATAVDQGKPLRFEGNLSLFGWNHQAPAPFRGRVHFQRFCNTDICTTMTDSWQDDVVRQCQSQRRIYQTPSMKLHTKITGRTGDF